jgi:hypothetical protein
LPAIFDLLTQNSLTV